MSELYEGVVFRADVPTARAAFAALVSPLRLRLVRLATGVFGVYRVAGRREPIDLEALGDVASQLANQRGEAVALWHDGRSCLRGGMLYKKGLPFREFGPDDEVWVPLGDDGELVLDGPRYRLAELPPGGEYDCFASAIDVALQSILAGAEVTNEVVVEAFCYDRPKWLAESPEDPAHPGSEEANGP